MATVGRRHIKENNSRMIEASTLTFVGVIIVGVLTAFGAILGHTARRITEIEAEQRDLEAYNDELWVYTRFLLDLYYRWRTPDAPDPDKPPSRRTR